MIQLFVIVKTLSRLTPFQTSPHGPGHIWCGRLNEEEASLIVTAVVAVQHHPARWSADDDNRLVLEDRRQPQVVDIEGPGSGQVGDEQDKAL